MHEVRTVSGPVELRWSAASDPGRVRTENEDAFLARAGLFVVADGMGGHRRGAESSRAAVAAVAAALPEHAVPAPRDVLAAVRAANDAVRVELDEDEPAGTTFTAVVLVEAGLPAAAHWMIVNVGDSRVYAWDGRTLRQRSRDHSAVQELIDAGELSPDEAERHPDRNVITRALGPFADVEVDAWLVPARGHDGFLLCSDGVFKELTSDRIARVLVEYGDEAAPALIDAAVAAGGRDNATAIVVGTECRFDGDDVGSTSDGARSLEETLPRN